MKKQLSVILGIFILCFANGLFAGDAGNTTIQGIVTIEGEIVDFDKSKHKNISAQKACSSWCRLNSNPRKGCYTTFGMCVPIGSICQCKVGNTTKLGTVR